MRTIHSQDETYINTELGITKGVGASLNSNKSRTESLRNVGADIEHVLDHGADLIVTALLGKDIVKTFVAILLLGRGVEGSGGGSVLALSEQDGAAGLTSEGRGSGAEGGGGSGQEEETSDDLHCISCRWSVLCVSLYVCVYVWFGVKLRAVDATGTVRFRLPSVDTVRGSQRCCSRRLCSRRRGGCRRGGRTCRRRGGGGPLLRRFRCRCRRCRRRLFPRNERKKSNTKAKAAMSGDDINVRFVTRMLGFSFGCPPSSIFLESKFNL